MKDQKGFGLVDAMIMSVILAISLMAIATIQTEYVKRQSIYLKRMVGQNLLASFISDMQTQGRLYPYLTNGSTPVTYVFCFNRDGLPLLADNNQLGAQVITTALDHTVPSPTCSRGDSRILGFELQMVRVNVDYADIHVIGLQNDNARKPGESVAYTVRAFIPQTY